MSAELLAANIAAHWVQSGVLAAAAIIAMRVMRLHEPRARLAALQLTVIAIIALPIVQPMRVEQPAPRMVTATQTNFSDAVVYEDAGSAVRGTATWLTPARAALVIAVAGLVLRLAWLFYGIITLARFSRAASDIPSPSAANDLEAALQLSPRYVQQTGSRGPWTFGCLRPTVALPADFDALAPEFQRAVICHELLHIKRRDIACAFVEELAIAALWFHPWMWLVRARIRVTREQVVDSRVVAMLDNRDDYVRCLVDLSGHDLAPHFSQAGAGMLRPRELRARVDAIFQEVHMSRLRVAVAAIGFVAVTITTGFVAVAAMPLRAVSPPEPDVASGMNRILPSQPQRAAQAQTATAAPRKQVNRVYPEYPQDALEAGIKGVVVVDITVNAAGDVSTAGVVSGPQALRASAFKAALGMKYTPGPSVTAMQITFEYVLTGTTWGVKIGEALPNIGLRPIPRNADAVAPAPTTNPDATGAYRIGNGLMPPKKIKDVPPAYPAAAQEARVQGVVIMEARVDEQGNVSDVRVLRSIPLLDEAAVDAVKQWQYTPTLMNGVAVPINMTVTVNFTLRPQVRMRISLPDGRSVDLGVRNGGIGTIEQSGAARYGFAPFMDDDPSVEMVKVTIYELGEPGDTPRTLATVELKPGSDMVYSATSPSFGIQLIEVPKPDNAHRFVIQ